MRQRLISLALGAAMVLSLSAFALADSVSIQEEIDGLNSQKGEIQRRMDDIQSEIDSLDFERATTLEKKEILDRKNMLAQQELDVIQEQIDIVDGLLSSIQADLAQAREEEQYQRDRWLTRLRAMEESSDTGYIQVLLDAADFSDLLTRLDAAGEVADYDRQLEAEYTAAMENVQALQAQAEQMHAVNEANRRELETKKAQLDADIAAACQLIAQMETDMDACGEILEQERQTQAEVEALIVEKQAELAQAKAAEEAARGGGSLHIVQDGSAAFLWPSYTSRLTSKFGPRYLDLYGYTRSHNGVDVGAGYGTSIWAADSGTVILAGWNGGYGNCVMVMHPSGYTTLYGHMSSISVSSGQTVAVGDVLGKVGSTGNSTGPHLHFEIRTAAGTPVNPLGFTYYYS